MTLQDIKDQLNLKREYMFEHDDRTWSNQVTNLGYFIDGYYACYKDTMEILEQEPSDEEIWGSTFFNYGYHEGYEMGHMEGQKFSYFRLKKVLEKTQDPQEILKEMWGYYTIEESEEMLKNE